MSARKAGGPQAGGPRAGASVAPVPVAVGYGTLALLVVATLAAGAIGSIATASSVKGWYTTIARPAWTPPNGVFGPVWTTLYLLMAVAAWRVRRAGTPWSGTPLRLFFAQLLLNTSWSFAFFGAQSPLLGLIVIMPLWVLIAETTRAFAALDRTAAALLLPYLAWVSYATALTAAFVRLNP